MGPPENGGGFSKPAFRRFGRPSKAENVVTPFTPIRSNFRDGCETQWMQIVRKQALGQVSWLFAISAQVPKLQVAGLFPVSYSIFNEYGFVFYPEHGQGRNGFGRILVSPAIKTHAAWK